MCERIFTLTSILERDLPKVNDNECCNDICTFSIAQYFSAVTVM